MLIGDDREHAPGQRRGVQQPQQRLGASASGDGATPPAGVLAGQPSEQPRTGSSAGSAGHPERNAAATASANGPNGVAAALSVTRPRSTRTPLS